MLRNGSTRGPWTYNSPLPIKSTHFLNNYTVPDQLIKIFTKGNADKTKGAQKKIQHNIMTKLKRGSTNLRQGIFKIVWWVIVKKEETCPISLLISFKKFLNPHLVSDHHQSRITPPLCSDQYPLKCLMNLLWTYCVISKNMENCPILYCQHIPEKFLDQHLEPDL